MSVVGIVAEYNPFHKGHAYQIEESRRRVGADSTVVCVMSGDFVQRGDVAIFNKHSRAAAAVTAGADLVFELPLAWSLSSAEGFAHGAVDLLASLGVVTHLSFGSECEDIQSLKDLAELLMEPSVHAEIKVELSQDGVPYAVARQRVLERRVGSKATLLTRPNNILGVEYIKAAYDLRFEVEFMAIERKGAQHDKPSSGVIRSASELRAFLADGRDIRQFVPESAWAIYESDIKRGRGPVTIEHLETELLARLRMLTGTAFKAIPDASEGLENKLYAAVREQWSWDGLIAAAKSKRYAMSRIRRMYMCAALGIRAGMTEDKVPYARILGMSERGRQLLRELDGRSKVPVLTKAAHVKGMGKTEQVMFELGSRARDFYVLSYDTKSDRRGGTDYMQSPYLG